MYLKLEIQVKKSISCGYRINRSRWYFQVDQMIKVNFANQTFWSRLQALLQDKQMWLPLHTEYHRANADVLFQLRFIHCAMVSPFVLASLSLWMVNEKVRNHWRGVNEMYGIYLLCQASGQMHIIWLHHPLNYYQAQWFWFKSARIVSCWDFYLCSWAVFCQYSCC